MKNTKVYYSYLVLLLSVVPFSLTAQAQLATPIPAITHENVSYGDHANHVIDFRKADVDGPAPLVVFIHGGGFSAGSHDKVQGKVIQQLLDAGIHHASVEYAHPSACASALVRPTE